MYKVEAPPRKVTSCTRLALNREACPITERGQGPMLAYHPASKPPRSERTGGYFLSLCCAVITAANSGHSYQSCRAYSGVFRTLPSPREPLLGGAAVLKAAIRQIAALAAAHVRTHLLKPAARNGKVRGKCRGALL